MLFELELLQWKMERSTVWMRNDVKMTPIDWARAACDSLMDTYLPEKLPPAGRWHYHQGVFLCGMEMLWQAEGMNVTLLILSAT